MLFLAQPFAASAAPVDVQKAMQAATNYLKINGATNVSLVDITATTPFSEFYVFAGANGKGFVLVSADDCVVPILGYSATNTFVTESIPAQIRGWLDDYEAQIRFYREHPAPAVTAVNGTYASAQSQWDHLLAEEPAVNPMPTAVSPLVTTTWDQSPLYNNQCPYDSYYGERTVTGCVATAVAQVMKYWSHPTTGYGSHSYTSDYGTLSANFGTTTYAWSSMPTSLTSSSTTTQVNAVATLMYHLGVALEMGYDVAANGGSGAVTYSGNNPNFATAENVLKYNFKYKSTLHHVLLDDYTDAQWRTMLTNELNNNRPIIYCGRDASGGHCFVCDGYNNSGLFHFNWGWGGWCDGYYAIGSLNPASGGTGGNSSYTFNIENAAVIGIEPNNNFGSTTTVTATANNSCGSVTGGGSYSGTNSNLVTLTATAATGCRFTQWSDGYKYNMRQFYANGGSYNLTANFEALSGDTLGYCSGSYLNCFGSTSGGTTWGVKLPASTLTNGHDLTKVMLYVTEAGSYTLTVYTGTTSPTTTVLTQTFNANSSIVGNWGVLTLTSPVTVDGTQSLWISLSSSNTSYPAAMTYDSGNPDSRLWGTSLVPNNSVSGSFMIRGIFEGSNTPTPSGDTLSYCGNNAYSNAVGAGGALTWGVRFPATSLAGRSQLTDVMLYVYGAGSYTMNIYQGTATNTASRVAQQAITYGTSAEESWQTIHLTTPVTLNSTQPLWVTFYNNDVDYPAATCAYTGDSNSSLVSLDNGSTWYSLNTASGGSVNGSWLIRAITSASSSPVAGDTVSYCGNSAAESSVGAGGNLEWGIRLPSSMYGHRDYLNDVLFYVSSAGTYTLNVYHGTTPSATTLAYTQTVTYTTADENSWKTIHLTTPTNLSGSTQPLWITFANTGVSYPAAVCAYTGDSNSSLVNLGSWMSLSTASGGSLSYSWMIKAVLSNTNTQSIAIAGPTSVIAGTPATFTVSGPTGAAYSWTLTGATPSTATGTTVTATWSNAGTYNVIVTATLAGNTMRDTLAVTVTDCAVSTFPYTMGFEPSENTDCWTTVDNDNDGYAWVDGYTSFGPGYAHTGDGFYASASYINDIGVLTPDNWLISPQMQLTAGNNYTLTWYDGAIDATYYDEHYAVYVSTTGAGISNFTATTPVFQTTLTTANYTLRTVDLSAYAGQNIYIAFRHYNSTDVFWLKIDDISITETGGTTPTQQYTVTVVSDNPTMGSVSGGGVYNSGSTATISATANTGYHFVQWNDGNTDAVRNVTVTSNITYTAYFAANSAPTYGDTVSYCGNSVAESSVGAGGSLEWGIRLPSSMYGHRDYLNEVLFYVYSAGTYTLNVYLGTTPSATTLAYTQTMTYAIADEISWKTIPLTTPINLSGSTQPLWITFTNTGVSYPAAVCAYTGDSNSSLVNFGSWMSLSTASGGSLSYSWMIKAVLSDTGTSSILVSGPTTVQAGTPATFTVNGPTTATYSWSLPGATPASASGTTVTATWNNAGTYNVIATATMSGTTLRDTLSVTVYDCPTYPLPFTCGFEASDNLDCWNFIDGDGDGYNWDVNSWANSDYTHSGTGAIGTASYINNIGALTPDQWMITPELTIPASGATLAYYVGGVSEMYGDKYSVYVSTTGSAPSDFTSHSPIFTETPVDDSYNLKTIDLSQYAGQAIRIGFRHYDSEDGYWLIFDDISVTANTAQQYTVTVLSANPTMGSVSGGGVYNSGDNVTITATANAGYHFVQWNDGNTSAVRTVTVTADITYTAYFAQDEVQEYTINCVSADPTMGTTTGGGTYPEGSSVTLAAIPNTGYHFVQWNDGDISNPRTIVVTGNATYVANFAADQPQGIDDVTDAYIIAARPGYVISITGVQNRHVNVYDALGRCHADIDCAEAEYSIALPCAGIYMVAIDNHPVQKVVLMR